MATNHECQPELIVYLDSKILDNKRKQKCSQMENEKNFCPCYYLFELNTQVSVNSIQKSFVELLSKKWMYQFVLNNMLLQPVFTPC